MGDRATRAAEGSALCVDLYYGKLPTARSRVCVLNDGEKDEPAWPTPAGSLGGSVSTASCARRQSRPDSRSVEAVFDPSAVNLAPGALLVAGRVAVALRARPTRASTARRTTAT